MIGFNGNKLPDGEIRLSDLLDTDRKSVRFVGLKPGQDLVIDVSLDGGYQFPDTPKKANWIGADGREGVHTALLTIAKGSGFTLRFTDSAELRNSRGRGLSIAQSDTFAVHDAWVRGARTAGIAVQECRDFTMYQPVTIDTSNYQDSKQEGPNWAGSIKFDKCDTYTVDDAISLDHLGNGITATESSNGAWNRPAAYGVDGANIYINASPGHTVRDGLAIGGNVTPPGYVVNSEEENSGASEEVSFLDCYALDTDWGLGFWGNERKAGVVIERANFLNGILISRHNMKIHPNANVLNFDDSGTLYFPVAETDEAKLTELRRLAEQWADKVKEHAPWAEIDAVRTALRSALAAMRGPVVQPIDRAALAEWIAEGADWLERGRALVV